MQLSSKVPLELFQTSRLDSTRHVFTPPPRTAKGLSPEQHLCAGLASRGTNVDLACLTSPRAMLHFTSRGTNVDLTCLTSPRAMLHFTSRGTYVDLACIPDLAHKTRNQC